MSRKLRDQDEGDTTGADEDGSRERAHDETVRREEEIRVVAEASAATEGTLDSHVTEVEGRTMAVVAPPPGDPDGSRYREHMARVNRGGN